MVITTSPAAAAAARVTAGGTNARASGRETGWNEKLGRLVWQLLPSPTSASADKAGNHHLKRVAKNIEKDQK